MTCSTSYTRLAVIMLAVAPLLIAADGRQSNVHLRKTNAIRSVWKPSQVATRELRRAMSAGDGTKHVLLEIMKKDHASKESLSFAASFSSEAAYMSAIEDPIAIPSDGFTVGTVAYPFRKAATRTYVILNGKPRIIDVTDRRFLRHINVASSKDFKDLWGSSIQSRCLWSEPQGYNIQPGEHDNTQVEVAYPIKDLRKEQVIGFAYVVFEFSPWRRRFLGAELEMVTDVAHKYFGATAVSHQQAAPR